MGWIVDPSIWVGLITLVIIELVLGVDSLAFIVILVEKLPPAQRGKAHITGLLLVTVMRLLPLASVSWLIILTTSLFSIHDLSFSAHDLIMLFSGFLLPFRVTMELNEWLEGKGGGNPTQHKGVKLWGVVVRIVIFGIIFSPDSVIIAVGMVDHLAVMMAAATIVISPVLLVSKSLTRFIGSHSAVIILRLSLLSTIGFNLVVGGLGFRTPEGYPYAVVGFSVTIEALNQLAISGRRRLLSINHTLRQRTAETVMRLLSRQKEDAELDAGIAAVLADHHEG